MSDHTPDFHEVRGAYISWLPAMFTEKRVAEFDRFIAKVKADALREAAEATRREAPGEPHAGASLSSHADWLDDRAEQIEGEV